jgi:hypothetical protein
MGRLRTRVERLEQLDPGGSPLPDQTGHAGEYLQTDGSTPSWAAIPPPSGGTVTSVGVSTGTSGVAVTGSPVTTTGTIDLGLGTAAAADTGDFDAAGDAAAAEAAANAYTDAAIAALNFGRAPTSNVGNGSLALTGTLIVDIPEMPYGGTITGWTIIGGPVAGNASVTVSHATYGAYDTMTSLFTASVSGAIKAQGSGLSHPFAIGDVIQFSWSGFASFTRCAIKLTVA